MTIDDVIEFLRHEIPHPGEHYGCRACECIKCLVVMREALREIINECANSLDCNHPGDDDQCSDIDDCIGCTLSAIARQALEPTEEEA